MTQESPETMHSLQVKLYAWQNYNFGPQPNNRLILGICEEVGELCHSSLKKFQGIRGTPEEHMENMKDAIGDIMIYTLNYLSGIGGKCPEIIPSNSPENPDERIQTDSIFNIARSAALLTASHFPAEDVNKLIMGLNYFCVLNGWDLREITRETCREVCKRDWKRFPKTGFPEAGATDEWKS